MERVRRAWRLRRAELVSALALVLIAALSVALRWPGFTRGGFVSHDVGAMLYSAMLLHAGGVPYVDTVELKAPGTFFLATWLAGPVGRDIAQFQVWANAWAVASLLGVGAIAWRVFGGRAAVIATCLYGLHDAFLDSMDGNYVTWAQLPMVLSVLAAVGAAHLPRAARSRAPLWLLAGLLAGLAALCKRPAGLVYGFVLLRALLDPFAGAARGEERGSSRARVCIRGIELHLGPALWTVAGLALSMLPIALFYLRRGHLDAFLSGFFFNKIGLEYLSRRADVGALHKLREGALATTHFLGLPLLLSAWTLGRPRGEDADPRALEARWLWLWFVIALAAASLGGRFYKGYFLAVAPALCVLAAAPWGLLGAGWLRGRRRAEARARVVVRVLMVPLALALLGRAGLLLDGERKSRARVHDRGGRIIGEHVARNTADGDRVWFWGWHLWDSYAYSGRLSGSRIHKPLGLLTPINDDTWRTPGAKLRLAHDSPYLEQLLADFEQSRPVYIVLGSTVPRHEFKALQRYLRREYVLDRRVKLGRVQFWQRKDRARAR